jgi:hypothetical protein
VRVVPRWLSGALPLLTRLRILSPVAVYPRCSAPLTATLVLARACVRSCACVRSALTRPSHRASVDPVDTRRRAVRSASCATTATSVAQAALWPPLQPPPSPPVDTTTPSSTALWSTTAPLVRFTCCLGCRVALCRELALYPVGTCDDVVVS